MLEPGAIFGGRYRLVRELGRGGMGVVWHARNEAIARDVALKLMAPALAASEASLSRFFAEARICGSIRHPGVVDVLDLGRAPDGTPFLVMELLTGVSLEDLIARRGRLSLDLACRIVRDVATTVALAHERGVIHRDLKPANIFLHRPAFGSPVAKVLDFGISKVINGESTGNTTGTGGMLGTPSYMSPEHAGGRLKIDHRSDVYALGVILYEALTGKLPYEGPTVQAILVDIATREPTPIVHHAPALPPMLVQVVSLAMSRDRESRLPSASALAQRIDAAVQALGLHATLTDADIDSTAAPRRGPAALAATTPAPTPPPAPTLQSTPDLELPQRQAFSPIGTVSPVSSGKQVTAPVRRGATVAIGAAITVVLALGIGGWRYLRNPSGPAAAGPDTSAVSESGTSAAPTSATTSTTSGEPTPTPTTTAAVPSATATASAAAAPGTSASAAPAGKPVKPTPTSGKKGKPGETPGMWSYE